MSTPRIDINAYHVVRGNGHDVIVVVAGCDLVDNDVVPVQRNLPTVLQVIILNKQ